MLLMPVMDSASLLSPERLYVLAALYSVSNPRQKSGGDLDISMTSSLAKCLHDKRPGGPLSRSGGVGKCISWRYITYILGDILPFSDFSET
jgi:hypothetical protein